MLQPAPPLSRGRGPFLPLGAAAGARACEARLGGGNGALTLPSVPPVLCPSQVTVCWVEETPAGNEQSLSPQAEHAGIRTYFFSAENTEEQESWIQAMGEAARVQIPPTQRSAPAVPPCPPLLWSLGGGAEGLGTF